MASTSTSFLCALYASPPRKPRRRVVRLFVLAQRRRHLSQQLRAPPRDVRVCRFDVHVHHSLPTLDALVRARVRRREERHEPRVATTSGSTLNLGSAAASSPSEVSANALSTSRTAARAADSRVFASSSVPASHISGWYTMCQLRACSTSEKSTTSSARVPSRGELDHEKNDRCFSRRTTSSPPRRARPRASPRIRSSRRRRACSTRCYPRRARGPLGRRRRRTRPPRG